MFRFDKMILSLLVSRQPKKLMIGLEFGLSDDDHDDCNIDFELLVHWLENC